MLDVGFSELLVFGIIALLVLGPDKLPVAARFAGKWYGKLKRMISNVQNDIDRELRLSEFRAQMQQEMQRIQLLEQKMQAQMQELQHQSLRAEQTQKPLKPSLVKDAAITYDYVSMNVPAPYVSSVWLKQHCHFVDQPSAPTIAFNSSKLKVAV